MSLSVLNNIAALYAQNYLNQTQAKLQTTLQQLSSGSRINSGADDAAGLAVVNGLQANEAALTQSAQNATNGIGSLQTADGALAQVTSLLNRAVTLATQAANSTLSAAQVSSANQEYQNILSEIGLIGSTTNFSGNQVFTANASSLFVSDGSVSGATTISNTVGVLTTASVGQTASTATITASALAAGTQVGGAANVAGTGTITFSSGVNTTTATGSLVINTANSAQVSLNVVGLTVTQIAAAINANASLQSQGITAAAPVAGVITLTGPANGQGGSITFGANTLVASAGTVAGATVTAAVDGRGTDTITLASPTNTISGTLGISIAGGTAVSLTVNAGTTGTQLAQQINSSSALQANGVSAAFNTSTGVLKIYGPSGVVNTFTQSGSLTQTTTLTPGSGVDFTSAAISTLTNSSAASVLVSVTNAIADVAYQRGILGANINQLTAASAVASTENVNLTSASNAIEATNYGQATSDLAKYEVLSQTGISALAQSNTVQQEILKLLQ